MEQSLSSEVLHLQVLRVILLNAVYMQPAPAPPKFISRPCHASSACFCHTLLLLGCVKPGTSRRRVDTVGTSLDTPYTSSHVHFPNCMCSIKEICIPCTEMVCLSDMMESEVLVFLERQKALGYEDVDVYQIMLNIHANLFSSK